MKYVQILQNDRVTMSRGMSSGDKRGSMSVQFINGGSFRHVDFFEVAWDFPCEQLVSQDCKCAFSP